MTLHFLAAHRRKGTADTGEQQTKVFIYLGACANGTPRIAARHFLFDGDGWWYASHVVALRFIHAPQELTGVRAQTFHVSALSLGIECVESQTALAAAAQSGYHDKLAPRNLERNVLEVVYPRTFDLNAVLHPFLRNYPAKVLQIIQICEENTKYCVASYFY